MITISKKGIGIIKDGKSGMVVLYVQNGNANCGMRRDRPWGVMDLEIIPLKKVEGSDRKVKVGPGLLLGMTGLNGSTVRWYNSDYVVPADT